MLNESLVHPCEKYQYYYLLRSKDVLKKWIKPSFVNDIKSAVFYTKPVKAGRHAVKGLRGRLYILSQQLSRHAQHETGGCSTYPSSRSAAKKSHGIRSGLSLAIISDVMSSPGINRHFVICIYTNKGHVTLATNSPAALHLRRHLTENIIIILQLFDKCSINVLQNHSSENGRSIDDILGWNSANISLYSTELFLSSTSTVDYTISAKCLQCLWTLLWG